MHEFYRHSFHNYILFSMSEFPYTYNKDSNLIQLRVMTIIKIAFLYYILLLNFLAFSTIAAIGSEQLERLLARSSKTSPEEEAQ